MSLALCFGMLIRDYILPIFYPVEENMLTSTKIVNPKGLVQLGSIPLLPILELVILPVHCGWEWAIGLEVCVLCCGSFVLSLQVFVFVPSPTLLFFFNN